MDSTTKQEKTYRAGGFGTSRAGVRGVAEQAPRSSSSYDCEIRGVDSLAPRHLSTTGCTTERPFDPAVPGPSGVRKGSAGAASASDGAGGSRYPTVRLERLGTRPTRSTYGRPVDATAGQLYISDEDGEDSDCSSVRSRRSSRSGRSIISATGRKRGRPPTTGEYVGLAEAKRKLIELTLRERELQKEADIEDPRIDPPAISKSCLPLQNEAEIAEDMRMAPTADLGATIFEKLRIVEKVASCSNKMKGSNVRLLREAALAIRHASAEQGKRTLMDDRTAELEAIICNLRARIGVLEAEVKHGAPSVAPQAPQVRAPRCASPMQVEAPRPRSEEVWAMPASPVRSRRSTRARSPARRAAVSPSPPPAAPSPPRADVRRRTSPPLDVEDMVRRLCSAMEERLAARFAALLLGCPPSNPPPRAPSLPKASRGQPAPTPAVQVEAPVAGSSSAPDKRRRRRRKRKKKRKKGAAHGGVAAVEQPPPAVRSGAPSAPAADGWTAVQSRKERRADGSSAKSYAAAAAKPAAARPPTTAAKPPAAHSMPPGKGAQVKKARPRLARAPKRAAVSLTVAPGSALTYAEAMQRAMDGVNLADVGIPDIRYRKGQTGASIIEVPGPDGGQKAELLAARLEELFRGTDVRVARPTKRAEARLGGLDESATAERVAAAIASAGGCPVTEVRAGAVKRTAAGVGTVWVQCPLAAMKKLVAAGRVRVGWTSARVEVLPARPLRCYRCLELGHTQQKCTADVDRGGLCYTCGSPGHRASECTVPPKCPVCTDLGRPAGHKLGSRACAPLPSKRGKRKGRKALPPSAPAAEVQPPAPERAVAPEEDMQPESVQAVDPAPAPEASAELPAVVPAVEQVGAPAEVVVQAEAPAAAEEEGSGRGEAMVTD